jgi:Fe-S-cluster containining protein
MHMGLLKPKSINRQEKWYAAGLRFKCQQCGNCCSGAPGYVWVDRRTIERIAAFLGREEQWLGKKYLRRVGFRYSLTEKPNGDCVFLVHQDGRTTCSIHPVRPAQCRAWPFWADNLRSRSKWEAAARDCPGMNQGRLHSLAVIEELRRGKGDKDAC